MNSFWIPQLGGQIYTMSGMAMTLYLQADHEGKYWGSGANFTGEHFGEMRFDVNATSDEDFDKWVAEVKTSSQALTTEGYKALAEQVQATLLIILPSRRIVPKYCDQVCSRWSKCSQ